MRKFSNHIAEVILGSGLNLNTICKSSGISHTYLTKLIQGNINRPGKDKIASVMLSLNYSIGEINDVLAQYDYQPLSRPDIPEILKNNAKRKVEGVIMVCHDHIYLDMMLAALAKIGGTKIILKDRPSALFMPDELYLKSEYPFSYEKDQRSEDFHHAFTLALLKERKSLFLQNCKSGFRFETYICKKCLTDYLHKNLAVDDTLETKPHKRLIVRYFANAIGAIIKSPTQHIMNIVERCAYFHMQIQDADGKTPKINFPGRKPHVYNNDYEQKNLEGFTTDSQHLAVVFKNEIDLCKKSVNKFICSDYPHNLIEYILGLFETFNLREKLASDIKWVVSQDKLFL